MSDIPELPKITTTAEFYAQALALETEASERYALLAEQMEVHNNRDVAEIFRKMAAIESQHHEELRQRAGSLLGTGKFTQFNWNYPEGPECTDFSDVHYLMTPHQVLQIAKHNEERAAAWFEAIAETASNPEIRAVAAEMAADERDHVAWVTEWLLKFPPPDKDWDEDYDPPVLSE